MEIDMKASREFKETIKDFKPILGVFKKMKYELKPNNSLSKRGQEWLNFSEDVLTHAELYTIPQYGDMPSDQASKWSAQDCVTAILKYGARFGSNSREGQDKLDLMKIAHYACIAANKLGSEKEMVTIPKEEYDRLINKE